MGVDDLYRVLLYLWVKDISVFPNERQQHQLATIQLFAAYTSARPAELVNGEVSKEQKAKFSGNWSSHNPWDDPDNSDYEQGGGKPERSKALCWEDVCLMLLRDPDNKEWPVVAMKVTLSHHKGVNRKPKP